MGNEGTNGGLWCSPVAKTSRPTSSAFWAIATMALIRSASVEVRRPGLAPVPDVTAIEDDLRSLAEDFGQGRITRGEWLAARGPLEGRLHAAHASIGQHGVSTTVPVNLRSTWPTPPVDRQRAILAAVFEHVMAAGRPGG